MTTMIGAAASYIDGRWSGGDGEPVATINPATGLQVALTPATGPAQVTEVVSAARRAFDGGEWSRLGPAERGALLHRLADLLQENRESLVQIAATEIGTPIGSGPTLHVDLPAKFFRWFADAAIRGPRDGYEQPMPLDHDPITTSSLLLRQPAGVVAAIVAYNVPIMMSAYKLGAALAAGCSTVLVTSPKSVLLTTAFVRLVEEAGFPAGAVNLVFGPPAVTEQVVTAAEVDMVTFTGSPAVGSRILTLAAPTLKKVVLELGGKSPNIVLPGTDLDRAVPASALRFTRNSGQACGATTRTLVPQADFDEYVERSGAFLRTLTVGDPLAPDTVLGPLITGEHRANVEGFLARARDTGADIPVGGGRPAGLDDGFFLEATLVTGVPNEAEIAQEELFAPVGVVMPYTDLDDAVRMANDVKYALNANVWGPTPQAIEFARRLRSGTVTINGGGGMRPDAPWGGPGHSGIGREGGEEGFREFFEVKHLQWPL
ncbi:aldehyde dehydrogenase family protein [Nocardia ignorata]|uniref:Aldehyde dehydrogenase (NAD+)/betaine-aldehyde dehydrogenase n=1 Tax=Nocardia ignorata TaxID=145285 RepID=A0A4R6PIP6_NOCIG|nr:aldehyde dehydrogenase family protein [Nocardia ignorata]TDP37725.1 aldehyde dehydrogenase (NAD+)/betaine-aldehyde dehydrogenase [Nocardia ignorata]